MGLFEVTTPQPRERHYYSRHLRLDFEHRTAHLDSKPVVLTRKEFDLLALLHQNAGELLTRQDLLMRVWGYGDQIRTRTLDVHIRRLRRKFGQSGGVNIETVFNVGYRLQPLAAPAQGPAIYVA
jgi:DNA-binding response OmpR family regulator